MTTLDLLIAGVGLVALGAGWRVVTTDQLVRAGLWLVVCLAAVAAEFLLLTAELVAWLQVLVYVGAVVVLLLFAVMLTRAPIGPSPDLDRPVGPSAMVGAGVGLGLATLLVTGFRWVEITPPSPGTAKLLGDQIFRSWVLPFEVVSILLLAALVGAIVISRPQRKAEVH
ncbi:NADH:ubiquinone oxidoreductase subunit 6 (subunit J) [Allocatelliglobosispora scoriae]|uniref:NADH-quinone oxidoreductase subunit J n=1 Tax=Allocatelliglobosispora scoriae TaxID=643052 RepID=A0A841BVC5_9ACTN|nr:NADH-quinone oxidoreductase subunit J [Allocatelliglobosispora scoriae]MBB5871398.1 NADH:ubiquinone oxidoreductase subunit 6 (subunit J) [Allocatelliglobosispora scoriae]